MRCVWSAVGLSHARAKERELVEARRIIKRLLPYLTHDAGCGWVKGLGTCSCEFSKLYQRALKLGALSELPRALGGR